MPLKTIDALDLTGKRVFIRVDFNVPLDPQGKVSDDQRIRAALPTIKYALDHKAKVILGSHLGRPKGKPEDKKKFTLLPVAERLPQLLDQDVILADDCVGDGVKKLVRDLGDGKVLLLENLRFHPEEEANDEGFARELSSLADVWVNDAFGTAHRAHASTAGMAKFVKEKAAGFLIQKEVEYLGKALAPPGQALRGHPRRRQGLGQDQGPREPHRQGRRHRHRRRHGLHLPQGPGRRRWARAGRGGQARPRPQHPRKGARPRASTSSCPSTTSAPRRRRRRPSAWW